MKKEKNAAAKNQTEQIWNCVFVYSEVIFEWLNGMANCISVNTWTCYVMCSDTLPHNIALNERRYNVALNEEKKQQQILANVNWIIWEKNENSNFWTVNVLNCKSFCHYIPLCVRDRLKKVLVSLKFIHTRPNATRKWEKKLEKFIASLLYAVWCLIQFF